MIHHGDITKINGAEIEPVDVIIGGSPCQDLSVAGKRAGFDGERSGLFMEQLRIIKEMRDATRRANQHIRPRFMVWENVPGAFSSAKGEDFRIVLEETARVADSNATIPKPPNEKWTTSGAVLGNGWSIAWRVLDAQFWGVPQRRRRIALVADFGGESAPEILFERKGVSRDTAESGQAREGVTDCAQGSIGTAIKGLTPWDVQSRQIFSKDGVWPSLYAGQGGGRGYVDLTEGGAQGQGTAGGTQNGVSYAIPINTQIITRHEALGRGTGFGMGENGDPSFTLQEGHCHGVITGGVGGGVDEPILFEPRSADGEPRIHRGISPTLNTAGGGQRQPCICLQGNGIDRADTAGCNGKGWTEDVSYTLNTIDRPAVFALDRASYNQGQNAQYDFEVSDSGIASALVSKGPSAVAEIQNWDGTQTAGTLTKNNANGAQRMPDKENFNCVIQDTVRRLTPLECERLQGFPDGWTDIPGASDSARYKALGNSIALPPWRWILSRIPAQTLGSLFDGIGGFPLIFEELHGKGSARWASEIERFPIAVTKNWFGEE